jgi:hypothetical protein
MATNRDLLKEAIADAKAVKETAIANAKAALEEAFTPYLKERLSAKLQEMENEEDNIEMEESISEEQEESMEENESIDEISLDELLAELEEENISEAKEEEESEEDEDEDEMSIGDMTPEEFEEFMRPEIEKVIKDMIDSGELEAGHEGMEDEEGDEDMKIEDEEESEEEELDEEFDINELLEEEEIDEEISLDELLAELGDEDGDVYEAKEEMDEKMSKELEEAYSTINTLRSELNEINLLNAKLLYTNKIFRNKSLTESQKIKVLTAFDKATSKKEAQLVYETLLENFKPSVKKSPIQESLGSASKALGVAKSKPIIENDAFSRMRELAFGTNK